MTSTRRSRTAAAVFAVALSGTLSAAALLPTAEAAQSAQAAQSLLAAQPLLAATSPFPVPVKLAAGTQQVITVQARGSYATVTAWQNSTHGWHRVFVTTAARVGAHGVVDGTTRVQNTYTTPSGTYSITQGFGNGPNPGTKMPYHLVNVHDWWVEDPSSRYYNQMHSDILGAKAGFHLTEAGYYGSEHLSRYTVQYHNALVINFNMNPTVVGRGAGIFLHDLSLTAGPTAGCVAVPAPILTAVLRWIDPAQHPVIAIA